MKGKNVSTNHGSSFAKGKNPFPKNVNTSAIRSDSHAKDDKNWASDSAKMRAHAHSVNQDRSNLPLQGVPGGDNLKGGK